jgi:membrane protease YdiL (CAAX protease family)
VTSPESPRRGIGAVVWAWLGALLVGNVLSALAVGLSGYASAEANSWPTWVVGLSVAPMWACFLVMMPRLAPTPPIDSGSVRRWFAPSDVLMGVPAGVLSQLVLVNVVNWPLSRLFPDSFSFDEVSKRAQGMTDSASGGWFVLLIFIVVIGAPFVEEFVYRGTLQPAFVERFGPTIGVIGTAVLFAAIHLQPVEFPGLFAFALVLGVSRQRSGTLGLPIIAHVAFNATGLALVILT